MPEPNKGGTEGVTGGAPDPDGEVTLGEVVEGRSAAAAASDAGGGAPTLHQLVVDGSVKSVTQEELIELAQKGYSSTQRWQQAAALERELGEEVRIAELSRKVHEGDQAAHRELLSLLGHPLEKRALTEQELDFAMDQVQTMLSRGVGGDAGEGEGEGEGVGGNHPADPSLVPPPRPQKVGIDDLSPDMRELLTRLRNQDLRAHKREMEGGVDTALDRDTVLGTILSKYGKDPKAKRVQEFARGLLRRRIVDDRQPYGTELVQEVVQSVRQFAEDIGVTQGGTLVLGQASVPGLGQSPAGLSGVSIPKEPVKMPSVTDPKYVEKMTQYLHQEHARVQADS